MVTVASPTYSSAGDIYAGRWKWPAWRRAIAANTVGKVSTSLLSSVDPEADPAVNPNYPGSAPWHGSSGQVACVSAWCGGTYDDVKRRLWLPLQGGHSDYAGNEPYMLDLSNDTPAWARLRNPSGAIGNQITLNDGQEATGHYSDGRPRSVHSYSTIVYVPGIGPISAGTSSVYYAVGGPSTPWRMREDTHEWTQHSAWLVTGSGAVRTATYDAKRHRLWVRSAVTQYYLGYLDLQTWTFTTTSLYDGDAGDHSMIYLPELDVIAKFDGAYFKIYGGLGGTPTKTTITPSGSPPSGFAWSGNMGIAWDGSRILLWNNSTNTATIATLTTNDGGATWSWGALSFTGVTPNAAQAAGTFGRFGYARSLGGCYLFSSVAEQVNFFAME